MIERLLKTCVHEAGHAVAAVACGFEVLSVSAMPFGRWGSRTLGRCILRDEPTGAVGVVLLAAGDVAVELLEEGLPGPARPWSTPAWYWSAVSTNVEAGPVAVTGHRPGDRERIEAIGPSAHVQRVAEHSARLLLRREWSKVRALADELLRVGQLDGRVVHAAVIGTAADGELDDQRRGRWSPAGHR